MNEEELKYKIKTFEIQIRQLRKDVNDLMESIIDNKTDIDSVQDELDEHNIRLLDLESVTDD